MTLHDFSQDVVPIVGTTVGLVGLIFVWIQLKTATEAITLTSKSLGQASASFGQTSNWNRINATYNFFDLARNSKIEAELYAEGKRLGITFEKQLSNKELDALVNDNVAFFKAKEFLNDFESYCVAYRSGVLDKDLAYQLLGTRLTKEYRVFSPFVRYLQTKFDDQGILSGFKDTSEEWHAKLKEEKEKITQVKKSLGPQEKHGL